MRSRDALRHVVAHLLDRALERLAEGEDVGRAVALDDDAAQAEQARAVVAPGVERARGTRLSTGIATSAASLRERVARELLAQEVATIICATPSEALSATLPTKPSHTTTSAVPL